MSLSKPKYRGIKFLVIKEKFQSGEVFIKYIKISSMVPDLLSKGLLPKVFHEHAARISIIPIDDIFV